MWFIEYCPESEKLDSCVTAEWLWVYLLVFYPRDHVADRAEAPGHCPASQENIITHITSPGKDPNPKFEGQFLLNVYCFHTM